MMTSQIDLETLLSSSQLQYFINSQLRAGYMPSGLSPQKSRVLPLIRDLEARVSDGPLPEMVEKELTVDHPPNNDRHHGFLLLSLERARSIIAPIRQLPVEILHEILQYMCDSTYSIYIGSYRYSPAVRLTKICSHWRETAHSLPELWTSISVDLRIRNLDDDDWTFAMHHLSRSRNLPLKVDITDDDHGLTPSYTVLKLWKLLLEHSRRWNEVHLLVTKHTLQRANAFPLLEGEGAFPNLRSLSLSNSSVLDSLPIGLLTKLTYLRLPYYSGPSLDNLFLLCNRLQVCILRGYTRTNTEYQKHNILIHHHLEELHLYSPEFHNPALHNLFFPKLKKLCAGAFHGTDLFLKQEAPGVPRYSLETLVLTVGHEDLQSAISIISTAQDTIIHLELDHCDGDILSTLFGGLSRLIMPRLQSLHISGDGRWDGSIRQHDSVCHLVQSLARCRLDDEGGRSNVEGLQHFHLRIDFWKDTLEWMQSESRDGAEITRHRLIVLERLRKRQDDFYEVINTRLASYLVTGFDLQIEMVGMPSEFLAYIGHDIQNE